MNLNETPAYNPWKTTLGETTEKIKQSKDYDIEV